MTNNREDQGFEDPDLCMVSDDQSHAHILLKSGPAGLPGFMRKLLTGYAINFNHQHRRHGHLFQNRYKSIVCEEDPCFRQGVSVKALQSGSRRRQISKLRHELAQRLVDKLGLTLAESARLLGVTTSAVARSLQK